MSYKVEILESSSELTARERVKLTTGSFQSLDKTAPIRLAPIGYSVLQIHNDESAENADYTKYLIHDAVGEIYATGSEAFFRTFRQIWDEMHQDPEPWEIDVVRRDSRKREGKYFLTCELV